MHPAGPLAPTAVLAACRQRDPARPRLTWYHDADDAARGERIELSARVLSTWVAKASNLLVDELDAEPGDVVTLDLPPHWRAVYWAWGAWSAGAAVELSGNGGPGVVVTDRPAQHRGHSVVAVSLPALARRWLTLPGAPALPATTCDEAAELMLQGDVFDGDEPTSGDAAALVVDGAQTSAADLLATARAMAALLPTDGTARIGLHVGRTPGEDRPAQVERVLLTCLAAWSVDGSVVVASGPVPPEVLERRWAAELVTSSVDPPGRPASRS